MIAAAILVSITVWFGASPLLLSQTTEKICLFILNSTEDSPFVKPAAYNHFLTTIDSLEVSVSNNNK